MQKSNFSSTFNGKGQVGECFIVLKPSLSDQDSLNSVLHSLIVPDCHVSYLFSSCQLPETTLTDSQMTGCQLKTIIDTLAMSFVLAN